MNAWFLLDFHLGKYTTMKGSLRRFRCKVLVAATPRTPRAAAKGAAGAAPRSPGPSQSHAQRFHALKRTQTRGSCSWKITPCKIFTAVSPRNHPLKKQNDPNQSSKGIMEPSRSGLQGCKVLSPISWRLLQMIFLFFNLKVICLGELRAVWWDES